MKSNDRDDRFREEAVCFTVTGIMIVLTSALIAFSSAGCSRSGGIAETMSVETLENGVVRVTHSQLSARPLIPDTIAVWNLWEEDSGYFFNRISAAASVEDHFYLCDLGNRQIVCVDLDGKVLFSFGRKGQGPGEFQFPFNLNVFGEEIWVADMMNGRFSVF